VGHFTLDNATNNGMMMRHLEEILRNRDIVFNAVNCKIMCFAHVIDLCGKQVTRHASDMVDSDEDDSHQSDYEAAATDPIACGRDVVQVIRGLGAHREVFNEVIQNGNDRGWFKQGMPPAVVKVESLELLRDVRTHWDSVFLMLNRLCKMRPVSFTSFEFYICLYSI